jgi:hypothetical protein
MKHQQFWSSYTQSLLQFILWRHDGYHAHHACSMYHGFLRMVLRTRNLMPWKHAIFKFQTMPGEHAISQISNHAG